MSCYIASSDNRIYAAAEANYCVAGTASLTNRIPAVSLAVRQSVERPQRRDKTGSRTFGGWPAGGARRRNSFDLSVYLAGWDPAAAAPSYGALFQAGLGGPGIVFAGGTVSGVPAAGQVQFVSAHELTVGQAIRSGGELRFVAAIVNPTTVALNVPFSTAPAAGSAIGKTISYLPATNLPSVTVFDYWSPATAVQRILAGGAVERMRVEVNGDFHQFEFVGVAADVVDNLTFASGQAGLTSFPAEPGPVSGTFSLVPGSLGQAWFGTAPSQFHTLLAAEVTLENNIDLRSREFGESKPRCIVAGRRSVSLDLELASDTQAHTLELYEAAASESPVSAMFQLGNQELHLCGVYLPAVVPEPPEFVDEGARLQWRFRNNRAQGVHNDEIVVAFG
jgi:hypothetical protein